MGWYINDLSLNGQFTTPHEFRATLEPVLQLRRRESILRDRLYCSRMLHTRPVTATTDLRQTVTALQDKNFTGLVLEWMSKSGPFWDDDPQDNEDDYFEYQGHDVTEQGLGEVSRRTLVGTEANAFSFTGSALGFAQTPLLIQHGLAEAPLGTVEARNYWEINQLEQSLESLVELNCWQDVHAKIEHKFSELIISESVMARMLSTPLSKAVTDRIFILLSILNQLVCASDATGKLSHRGEEILANYFAGTCGAQTPIFKPETPSNRRSFKQAMTFPDPTDGLKTIFCHWHGKIQTPQTRIHFEWPRPDGQRKIKVVYIGPKITKA